MELWYWISYRKKYFLKPAILFSVILFKSFFSLSVHERRTSNYLKWSLYHRTMYRQGRYGGSILWLEIIILSYSEPLNYFTPLFLMNSSVRSRFTKEASCHGAARSPNIIHVHDHGLEGMTLYIVMEYVKGSSSQNYLNTYGNLSLQISHRESHSGNRSWSFEYSPSKRLSSSRYKPDNMLIAERGVKLTDFAPVQVPDTKQTQTKAIMGTPAYMPPEQRISAKKSLLNLIFILS